MKFLILLCSKIAAIILLFTLIQCQSDQTKDSPNTSEQPTTNADAPSSQTSTKITFSHAKGISVDYQEGYKLIKLYRTTLEAQDTLSFILLDKGATAPQGFDESQIIQLPIKGMIPMSATFLEPLNRLNLIDQIVGIEDLSFVTQPEIKKYIEDNHIPEVGSGDYLMTEKVLSLQPDIIMTSGFESGRGGNLLYSLGLKIIPNLDWQESTPLGRAEWVKYIAVFFGKEQKANQLFDEIEKKYLEVVQLTKNVKQKPSVLVGLPFKGTWYMAGGQSYIANLIKDAGAQYTWEENENTGAIPLDLETVYPVALEADYWINVGTVKSLNEIFEQDERFGDFKAFKNRKTYNNNRRTSALGGNDYWNSGVTNPHLILSDLVKIFHPEVEVDQEYTYYHRLIK